MLIAIGGKALEIVFDKEFAEERGVLMLDGDEPRQDHGEVKRHARPPEGAAENGPLAPKEGKGADDDDGQKRRYRTFGKGGQASEKVDVVEPEFGIGFVPRVPAEKANGQWRGHLHVSGCATRKADDAGACHGDQRCVQMATRPEAAHVEVNEADHDEGERCGGQAGAPVMDAKFLKEQHGPPVVKGRLLQPGMAVEIRGYAGAELFYDSGRGVNPVKHLMGNLGITGLVGAQQKKKKENKIGRKAVCQEEDRKKKENGYLADGGPTG